MLCCDRREEEGKAERCKDGKLMIERRASLRGTTDYLHLQIIRFFQWRTINENGEHK